ncbi:MAG: proton extrusion protein PcxA [Limnospira sp.]
MPTSTWTQFKRFLDRANRWFRDTPDRALDQAYDAALRIRAIEDEHFNGEVISAESGDYGDRVRSYFQSELNKYLKIIQMRLAEFNTSRSILGISEQIDATEPNGKWRSSDDFFGGEDPSEQVAIICEKLDFIDSVTDRYQKQKPKLKSPAESKSLVRVDDPETVSLVPKQKENRFLVPNKKNQSIISSDRPISPETPSNNIQEELKSDTSETSFLPRSLLRTMTRIKRELNPESEDEVLKNYRKSKVKTIISIRFILLLILVPLLTQQLAKNFIVGPAVNHFLVDESTPIFMNTDMEEEAFVELQRYEERLKFESLIGLIPELSEEELEERTRSRAAELAEEYRSMGSDAIQNVFADILATLTFGLIIYTNKREVAVLKSFMGDLIYGLSDSAKAFIIILLTDMFVGFHSPHGWEVILESIARHFGLPENRDFNFLFIATFPVILDAVFKYWIFRYLNRSSPSAVSTYKTMNE